MLRRSRPDLRSPALAAAFALLAPVASAGEDDKPERRGFSFTTQGYVQFDLRAFGDWDLPDDAPRLERDAAEVRRLRAGGEASWRSLSVELSVDPFDEDGAAVKDARADVRVRPWLRLRTGQFKLPGGREYDTSPRRLGFLERSALSSVSAGRDLGVQVALRPRGALDLELGVFAGDGRGREDRSGVTAAGRLSWEGRKHLDLGAYLSLCDLDAVPDSESPTGINGRSSSGWRFFDRLYVAGRRSRLGGDIQWERGRFRFGGEALRLVEQRRGQAADGSDLPDLVGQAVTLSARWQRGAAQARLRYERLRFDDAGAPTALESVRPRAADVRARGVDGLASSLGVRFARWIGLLGEVSTEWYSEPTSAPSPGRTGPYLTAGLRLQVERP
jgi:hypothetical protein